MSTLKANRYENTASSDGGIDIDSSGKVGVGVASPDGTFHIHTASAGSVTAATGADDLVIENSGDTGISILAADGNNTTAILFGNATDNLGAAIRWNHNNNEMSIGPDKSGAHLRINSGDGAEACRVLSGGGLTFNGDTSTANALDDYEEGTFTPTAQGSTTAGTASYSQQVGKYTKIGDRVFFEIYIHWDSGTGSGSALYIYGLPFAAQSSSQTYPAASIGYFHNISFTANSSPGALVASGSTYVYFYAIPNGGGSNAAIAYDSAGSMIISGHYKVN